MRLTARNAIIFVFEWELRQEYFKWYKKRYESEFKFSSERLNDFFFVPEEISKLQSSIRVIID